MKFYDAVIFKKHSAGNRAGRGNLAAHVPLAAYATLLAGLLLSGCSTLELDQNKLSKAQAPISAPATTGTETAEEQEHRRLVALYGGEYFHAPVETLLTGVLARLAKTDGATREPYRLTLLNSAVVNAFALPSGRIYVTRGLLALANDTAEVAAVMAHEIAHVTAKHAAQRAELEKDSAVISKAATIIQTPEKGQEVKDYRKLSLASFSRAQEFEADRVGISTVSKAGYEAYGASRFLTSLGRSTALRASLIGQKGNSERPDILSTHPSTPERIREAVSAARQIAAPGFGETGHDAYLAALNGLVFGDDPSEGVIRTNHFTHPKLDFTFTAPNGFVLENSPQALLGLGSNGAESVRLDSVRLPASTTLEDYLTSGWIEGLDKTSITPGSINSFPATFATAKDGAWSFKLVVIRFGTDIYRLIFATKTLNADADQRFLASMNSFRRISTQEAAKVQPLKISIHVASSGDSFASMAAQMSFTDRPEEHFRLLNGLEPNEALVPGQSYKIVSE